MPESYTDPADAYATAKRRGMDFVALTDHNTISGALEIAHHPDVVIGVEVTAELPEDRTPLHVLVWGVTEADWAEMDALRRNVYELVDYVERAGLPHALAHPLHRVGQDLTPEHLERCLLLFSAWEGRNGARPEIGNEVACRIARSARREYLEKLGDKHGIVPRATGPLALTGGSDDHGLLDVATAWTETPPAADVPALLAHLLAGRTAPGGAHGSSEKLAHAVGTLLVRHHLDAGIPGVPPALRDLACDLVGAARPAVGAAAAGAAGAAPDPASLGAEVMARIRADRKLVRRYRRLGGTDAPTRHRRLSLVADWLHSELIATALGSGGESAGTWGRRLEALVGAAAVAAPRLVTARYMEDERRFARSMGRSFFGGDLMAPRPVTALMLTDTVDELNGVAGTMRRLADYAARRPGCGMEVVTCGAGDPAPGLRRLGTVTDLEVPAYGDRAWRVGVPSLPELAALVEEREVDVIHAATPGPMGLAGLLIARLLGRRFVANHHTELARYVGELTGDRLAAELTGRAVRWFYGQAERVYAPTRAAGRALMDEGIDPRRIYIFGRGVDLELFRPQRRSRLTRRKLGGGDATVVLYVGRLSPEKGLPLLAEAFRRASASRPDLALALVGEGPGRPEIARALAGTRHRFLGPLRGEALAAAYASADLFCLPSSTETFGQVVQEAGASGLPAIVLDRGAARESVEDGITGLVVPAGDAGALAGALGRLADDPALRAALGGAARRAAAARRGWDEVFDELLAGYAALGGPRPNDPLTQRAPA
jgi:glycosyltransferase involved in cell wall biosynthesis